MGLVLTGELGPKSLKTRRRLADVYERQASACFVNQGDAEDKVILDEGGWPHDQRRVAIGSLEPNPRSLHRQFAATELDELAASIKERGVIQPIAVRPAPGATGAFEIIAGERRWRAAQRAGIHEVPVVVLDASDVEALELAIIENLQREDLNPLEEAAGYQALGDEFKYSQDEIAQVVGKSRSHITDMLRLLELPEAVQACIRSGEISAGHARALTGNANASGSSWKGIAYGSVSEMDAEPDESAIIEMARIRSRQKVWNLRRCFSAFLPDTRLTRRLPPNRDADHERRIIYNFR